MEKNGKKVEKNKKKKNRLKKVEKKVEKNERVYSLYDVTCKEECNRVRILRRLNPRSQLKNDIFDVESRYETFSFVQIQKSSSRNGFPLFERSYIGQIQKKNAKEISKKISLMK